MAEAAGLVVVTGASAGIGEAVAAGFAKAGHPVLLIARRSGTIINVSSIGDRKPGPAGEIYHACKAAVRSLGESMQQANARHNIRVVNVAPGFIKTNIHAQMGITFEEYCARLGNPTFISSAELADIILFCWRQPPHICIRDIVVMPTSSAY